MNRGRRWTMAPSCLLPSRSPPTISPARGSPSRSMMMESTRCSLTRQSCAGQPHGRESLSSCAESSTTGPTEFGHASQERLIGSILQVPGLLWVRRAPLTRHARYPMGRSKVGAGKGSSAIEMECYFTTTSERHGCSSEQPSPAEKICTPGRDRFS